MYVSKLIKSLKSGTSNFKCGYSNKFITLDKSLGLKEVAINSARNLGRSPHCKLDC